jgi:diguanylate cyclase
MDRKQPVDKVHGLLRLALPLMSQLGIPVTPKNYTVWYKYVSGKDGELSKAIDGMRENNEMFSEEKNEDLYKKYCTEMDENELSKIREDLQKILLTILKEVTELTGQTEEYETFVTASISRLSHNAGADDIRAVISEIIDKTKALGKHGKAIQHKLKETKTALSVLRKDFEQVKNEVLADFLTGIPNRRAFNEKLSALCNEAESDNEYLSLLLIDIDRFKRFNDQHGHLLGDAVLRFVARKAKEIVKGRDFLARFGGEEFAIILPKTPLTGARVVAENIRRFFAEVSLKAITASKNLGKITVSVGAACYRPGEPIEALLERSDQALYLAKDKGRNRVVTESELQARPISSK